MAGPCGCPLPTLADKEAWLPPWALALPTSGAGPNGAAVTEISLLPPFLLSFFLFFFLIKKPSQELKNESPTFEFQRLPLQMDALWMRAALRSLFLLQLLVLREFRAGNRSPGSLSLWTVRVREFLCLPRPQLSIMVNQT